MGHSLMNFFVSANRSTRSLLLTSQNIKNKRFKTLYRIKIKQTLSSIVRIWKRLDNFLSGSQFLLAIRIYLSLLFFFFFFQQLLYYIPFSFWLFLIFGKCNVILYHQLSTVHNFFGHISLASNSQLYTFVF